MAAVSTLPLANVVERSSPFQRTNDPGTKFPPVTVNVKPAEPTAAEFGPIQVINGVDWARTSRLSPVSNTIRTTAIERCRQRSN